MSINEITAKIEALQEWEALASEAAAQVESIKDELKEFMNQQGVEEYEAGTHIIRWTTVLSNRFDSTAFKKVIKTDSHPFKKLFSFNMVHRQATSY